ncbi:hypothetical protein P4V06_18785 [Brevibacillus parabrevis]|nr:hypothetical protein [Brevibacillus parabrevis]
MGLYIADFSSAILAALLELAFPLVVNRVVDDLLPSGNWLLILYACLGLQAQFSSSTMKRL